MKTNTILLAMAILISTPAISQEVINYQAVIRNASNELVINAEISFEFGILLGGDQVYVERHVVYTDMNGQLSLKIGKGTVVSGVFDSIKWGSDYMEILIRCDIDADGVYDIINTEPLNSVPYAHYAQQAVRAQTSADNKWTGTDDVVVTLSPDAMVGVGTTEPLTKLSVNGAIALYPTESEILITADDFFIEVGDRSYLTLESNDTVGTNRSIILGDGLAPGQLLILQGTMADNNFLEIADNDVHNTNMPVSFIMGNADVVTLVWSGSNWLCISVSNNE